MERSVLAQMAIRQQEQELFRKRIEMVRRGYDVAATIDSSGAGDGPGYVWQVVIGVRGRAEFPFVLLPHWRPHARTR